MLQGTRLCLAWLSVLAPETEAEAAPEAIMIFTRAARSTNVEPEHRQYETRGNSFGQVVKRG